MLFEKAARSKYRFPYKGSISSEDLYDLTVQELDGIYKKLNKELKDSTEESLLSTRKKDEALEDKVNIVKHVVATKLAEADAKEKSLLRSQQKQKILGIIASKQDEADRNRPIEELQAMLDQL